MRCDKAVGDWACRYRIRLPQPSGDISGIPQGRELEAISAVAVKIDRIGARALARLARLNYLATTD